MGEVVDGMIADVLVAFEREDLAVIANIQEREEVVDALRYSIFRECLTYMMEDQKNITRCTNYVMIARYLERCGGPRVQDRGEGALHGDGRPD
ncbi:hypothetical protein [Methanoculleus chikugoensis]|uniref:phosphate signaling complex PhoU family protein n=1 Tax=Methanoculleus chikugoensis TaxID=118126 RepID=UPI001FB20007|nr:PhoU domain-containing protein [Methanoculleus chikugoensis]